MKEGLEHGVFGGTCLSNFTLGPGAKCSSSCGFFNLGQEIQSKLNLSIRANIRYLSNWENSNSFSCDSESIVLWIEFSGKSICNECIKVVEAIALALIKYGPIRIKGWTVWKSF